MVRMTGRKKNHETSRQRVLCSITIGEIYERYLLLLKKTRQILGRVMMQLVRDDVDKVFCGRDRT